MKNPDVFPVLTSEQIDLLSTYGDRRAVKQGEYIISAGERNSDFFVVLDGILKITDEFSDNVITMHSPGEFTGDSTTLSGRASIFNAIAESDLEVLQIKYNCLKELISKSPNISDILLRTFLLRRIYESENNFGSVKLLGSRFCSHAYKLREFLSKNHVQYVWIDLEKDETSEVILQQFGIDEDDTPIVITNHNTIYKTPTIEEIAEVLGISSVLEENIFDVVVVGAGPAGLAASVYAASEGLTVLTIDEIGPGGQAGSSSRIENYLGFPMGISGSDLANQAYIQAQKFGCNISIPHQVKNITFEGNAFHLELVSGRVIKGSTVIAATGARYRKLPLPNLAMYEGLGVYYGATNMEAQLISGKEIIIVGGGNSAGQAAIFLAGKSPKVHLVIRGDDLSKSMSTYLVNRIINDSKIELHTNTEVVGLEGDHYLEKVVLQNKMNMEKSSCHVSDLFLFLGALPCSEWLKDLTCVDEKGFVYTGRDIPADALETFRWPLQRPPQSLETCIPGLFAVGDLRSGSVKRVASAVGEGSMAVSQIHAFLNP